ncbi:MAG: hypothetical protein A2V98_22905 [Planctomycetes bacterium RBG_16_64_12]|nr:MAG: hypothetical protein A2V98_22905 [Planctomycetes bacterium RBG_16_64_12]
MSSRGYHVFVKGQLGMGKVRDGSKERYWRKLIRRQGETGEAVAQFCARQGVTGASFRYI